jgi:uncharacterized membrane protein
MTTFLIILAVIIIGVFISVNSSFRKEKEAQERKRQSNIARREKVAKSKEIMKAAILSTPDFSCDDELIDGSMYQTEYYVAFDKGNKKLCYLEKDASQIALFSHNEIINCELKTETNSKTKTIGTGVTTKKGSTSRALVGGAIAGGAGAIVGSMSAKEKHNTTSTSRTTNTTTFILDIYTNDVDYPCITVKSRWKGDEIKKWYGYVLSMIEENEKQDKGTPQVESVADEILKLKQLQSDGILSNEEFEKQKQKILDK